MRFEGTVVDASNREFFTPMVSLASGICALVVRSEGSGSTLP